MAILDIQVVATSLPAIQDALSISRDAMSWIQTAYLIAEIIAIPLTGWLTRVLTLRWLFVAAIALFTAASIGCAFSGDFATLIGFRVLQGFAGGTLIPAVFSAVFLLVSDPPASGRDHDGRHHGGAGAHDRPGGRRLDHRDLVLALAVPDQCRSRHHRRGRDPFPAAARATSPRRSRHPRRHFAGADGDRAGEPGDRPEAGPAGRLAFAALCAAVFRSAPPRQPCSRSGR